MRNEERIVTLDILRGLALFGMILVHFHQRMEIPSTGAEDLVGWGIWIFVETKSWATFAFLFGAGFAILMRRAEARGFHVVSLFLRRLAGLAIIGIAVEALFGFSILFEYAIWGVPLLFVRSWSTRSLLVLAFLSAIAGSVYHRFRPYERGPYWSIMQKAEAEGTFMEAANARIAHMEWSTVQLRTLIPGSSFVLFILGLLSIRHRIFEDPRRNRGVIVTAMLLGAISWAIWWLVLRDTSFEEGMGIVRDQWLAFTYIGAVTLLLTYRRVWIRRLSAFGIAGKMALTNYVLQAAIFSWLRSGYGLGLKIRPYYELPATILLFLILVLLSKLWLARYPYGPLERVWRRVTYW